MKKVILFGAGQLGYSAFMFFGEDIIECFVDNNSDRAGKIFCGKKIISFKELLEINNDDYEIIISTIAYEIISAQLTKAGISNYKKFDYPIIYDYVSTVKSCFPKELISSTRLDVAIKYLYAKDILSAIKNTPNKSLYARLMLTSTGCTEQTFQKLKDGLDDHFNSFENLCKSIQEEGFKEEHYIPIAKNNSIHDGAHRLAVALALEKDVFVGVTGEQASPFSIPDFSWYAENGFSVHDRVRMLRGFSDLYDECGILVLFGAIKEQWDYIEAQAKKEFKVVGSVDIDLSHNFIAYEILIKEIYGNYSQDGPIANKISLLKMSPLITRVILVSNELKKLEINEFYNSITQFKLNIRDIVDYEINKESYCMIHSSSNYNEFIHLKNILLSVNNLNSIEGRISSVYHHEFLRRILFVRDYCKENNIPVEDVCVIGTCTMEVLGIKKAVDLDFIIASDLHPRILPGYPKTKARNPEMVPKHLTKGKYDMSEYPAKALMLDEMNTPIISIIPYKQTYLPAEDKMIDNDILIRNDSYYIWFYGLKFLNLDFQISKKTNRDYEKDRADLRTIELYHDFIRNFDNKKVLKEQIEAELKRRGEMEKKRNEMMGLEAN